MAFTTALIKCVIENLGNNYSDNYDFYRFGDQEETQERKSFFNRRIKRKLKEIKFLYVIFQLLPLNINAYIVSYNRYKDYFKYLYGILNDDQSKELLIKLLAYRIMGWRKVKLPTNNELFWKTITSLDKIADKNRAVDIDFMKWKQLYFYDLDQIGYPIRIYSFPNAIYIYPTFVLKQYEYHSSKAIIKVENGDVVIDAGAFSGENTLFFAYQAGSNGKVYSFEFIPSNIVLIRKNIDMNPELKDRITIVQNALWSESGITMYCLDNGPASSVKMEKTEYHNLAVKTLNIDDFVAKHDLPKIDFIKMDIEGAELAALKGAEKTIRKHRPKLAISIYHNKNDFRDIPQFIRSLDLGYQFYLGHYTIHAEETILYATLLSAKKNKHIEVMTN